MSKIEVIHGDCLKILPDLKIDWNQVIFVSDPPYNQNYHYSKYKDNLPEEEYLEMLADVFLGRSGTKHVLIHYPEMLYKYAYLIGVFPERVVSWVYNSNTPRQHRDIVFFNVKPDFKKGSQPYKNPNDKRIKARIESGKTAKLYDWWEINQVKNVSKEKTEHPCQIPEKVMYNIISILPENYTIIDPFCGAGTTGVACKELNRDFIGIEMDEKYFEISKNRLL